jgi:hypothetical protein
MNEFTVPPGTTCNGADDAPRLIGETDEG